MDRSTNSNLHMCFQIYFNATVRKLNRLIRWHSSCFIPAVLMVLVSQTIHAGDSDIAKSVNTYAEQFMEKEALEDILYDDNELKKHLKCSDYIDLANNSKMLIGLCASKGLMATKYKTIPMADICILGRPIKKDFLITFSKDKKPSTTSNFEGYMYYMGRTDGWTRDYDNIFLDGHSGSTRALCWRLVER